MQLPKFSGFTFKIFSGITLSIAASTFADMLLADRLPQKNFNAAIKPGADSEFIHPLPGNPPVVHPLDERSGNPNSQYGRYATNDDHNRSSAVADASDGSHAYTDDDEDEAKDHYKLR